MNNGKLIKMIDQTILKANAGIQEVKDLCNESKEYGFACVMVNPVMVKYCYDILKDTDIHVGTVIGFPLGQNMIETKVSEAELVIKKGAKEIDYVLNISELLANNLDYIKQEMEQITKTAHDNGCICKVILETCYLSEINIYAVCRIAAEIGVDFVKTSTGFGTEGATVENVAFMKNVVGENVKVKASGGIKTLDFALKLIEAGAERIGTSSGVSLLSGIGTKSDY